MPREYLPKANDLYRAWRKWQAVWSWANILIGGSSTGLGALVAANTQVNFLDKWTIPVAVAAPVLTFLLTTLKPQANATAFETASRELEKARNRYEADPTKDDVFLSDGIDRGIDLLNRIGSA
jgi:hypothetical protein